MLEWGFDFGTWSIFGVAGLLLRRSIASGPVMSDAEQTWRPGTEMKECVRCENPKRAARMVIGITHSQTCLVMKGRLRALREAGFDVTLVSSPGPLLEKLSFFEGVTARPVSMAREIDLVRDFISLFRLWRMLHQVRPEVVEFSTPKAGLLGMIAASLARVPHRVYLLRGLKLETATGWERTLLWGAERLASACSQAVLCTSPSVKEMAQVLRIAPPQKLHVLGNGSSTGVDIDHFCPGGSAVREEFKIASDAHVIGFVGRLTRDKGVPELVEAFRAILDAIPNTYLLLVGWFDEAEDALDFKLRNGIMEHPRIVCTGLVEDTAPYYRAMDVMVLPTRREGFPNAVLEASASGVAVITTLATGARDAVIPGVTGLLIPAGTPEALAEAAVELLRDDELRKKMGSAGRAWVSERFSRARVLGQNVKFFQELAGLPGEQFLRKSETTVCAGRMQLREAPVGRQAMAAEYARRSEMREGSYLE